MQGIKRKNVIRIIIGSIGIHILYIFWYAKEKQIQRQIKFAFTYVSALYICCVNDGFNLIEAAYRHKQRWNFIEAQLYPREQLYTIMKFHFSLHSLLSISQTAAWYSDLIPFLRSEIEMPVKCFDCIAPTFTRDLRVNNK